MYKYNFSVNFDSSCFMLDQWSLKGNQQFLPANRGIR